MYKSMGTTSELYGKVINETSSKLIWLLPTHFDFSSFWACPAAHSHFWLDLSHLSPKLLSHARVPHFSSKKWTSLWKAFLFFKRNYKIYNLPFVQDVPGRYRSSSKNPGLHLHTINPSPLKQSALIPHVLIILLLHPSSNQLKIVYYVDLPC